MRKRILLLATLLALYIIGGGLYNTLAQFDSGDEKVVENAYGNPFSHEMPNSGQVNRTRILKDHFRVLAGLPVLRIFIFMIASTLLPAV